MITLLRHSRIYNGLCVWQFSCDSCKTTIKVKAKDKQDAMNGASAQGWWVCADLILACPPIIGEVMAQCPPCNETLTAEPILAQYWAKKEAVNAH